VLPAMSRTTPGSLFIGFWSLLDQLLTTMLFLLMGLEILNLTLQPAILISIVLAIPLAIAARMISVAIPLTLTGDSVREMKRAIVVLTWAGLRGGISVALALTLPPSPWRESLLAVTFGVVIVTIVAQGLTLAPLLRSVYRSTQSN